MIELNAAAINANVAVDRATGTRHIYVKTPGTPVSFTAPPELYERIKKTAKDVDTNVSELCRVAMTSYLDHLEEECDLERDRR